MQWTKSKTASIQPSVTVVVAVRNEEKHIHNTIESILKQDYPDFEVIIVNDHSNDSSNEIMESLSNDYIRLVSLPGNLSGKKAALRYGIGFATSDWILVTDGDCLHSPNWISSMMQNAGCSDMILGPVAFLHSHLMGAFVDLELFATMGVTFGMVHYQIPVVANGANMAFKRDVYNELDGIDTFQTPSGDDVFLLQKFRRNNKKIVSALSRNAVVRTNSPSTISSFFHQRFRWASKSRYFKGLITKCFGGMIVLVNLIQLIVLMELILNRETDYWLFLVIKFVSELILVSTGSIFYKQVKQLIYIVFFFLMYPFYSIFVTLFSLFVKYDWKGRVYN